MISFYIISTIVTFLGIVINLPGTIHLNPLMAHFYEPRTALFLTTAYLVMGALSRIIIFKKEIIKDNLLKMCIFGALGGISAGFFIGHINSKILLIIFLLSGLKFIYEFIYKKDKVKLNKNFKDLFIASYIAAFIQSFGIPAGNIRQGYYYSQGYNIQNVQGTVAVVFLFSGIGTIISRITNENIPYYEILKILPTFPIMLITMYMGKKILYKIHKSIQDKIILYSLILSMLSVIPLFIN